MATFTLPTPFGIRDDASGGTTVEDMQRIIAAKYEFRTDGSANRGGIIHHDGISRDGRGVELRPDATLRVHEGVVLLDIAPLRCVEAAVPYVASIDPGLAVGTAGTVTVAVAPPTADTNDSRLITTTGTAPTGSVVLERLVFPSGWKTTNQATRNVDRSYAVPRGTANGRLSSVVDADTSARKSGSRYKRLSQSFVVPTDANLSFELSTTLRACTSDGSAAVALSKGLVAAVNYAIYLDGTLITSFERPISGFSDTQYFGAGATVSAGRHEAWVESWLGPVVGSRADTFWQVMQGGSQKHRGDFMAVRHEGVRW